MVMIELVGNMHIHSVYSDGTATHCEIAEAAARAGLDWIIVTDHNIWVDGVAGYYENVLLLVGEEIHDCRRVPQANHLLVYGADGELARLAANPQAVIDAANERGALTFLAHPVEYASRVAGENAFGWDTWDVTGYTGLEIWNYMSEFKARIPTRLHALWYAYFPTAGIRGPFKPALELWDSLMANGQRVVGIGGADAHANSYSMGPLRRTIFPYEYLFRAVNTHILAESALTGDVATDQGIILNALRAGRAWVGCDALGSACGFYFEARSGANQATMGDELSRAGAVTFEVTAPLPGDIQLVCNGRAVARASGQALKFLSAEPGRYRAQVYRGGKGWIFSNPIFVR
jgi:hypothetical protein